MKNSLPEHIHDIKVVKINYNNKKKKYFDNSS